MIETNIRLIKFGTRLHMDMRHARVRTQDFSPNTLQKACGALARRFKLAAVPSRIADDLGLLVVSNQPISDSVLGGDDWRVEIKDSGEVRRLTFANSDDMFLLAQLVQRCLLIEIARRTNLWQSPDSNRIWYESEPFLMESDISAYRRFEVATVPITSVGLGVIVDVGTAFLTNLSVADYFDGSGSTSERELLRKRFEALGQRQRGQKGTLLYDIGGSRHTCYFVEYLEGVTCGTTGTMKIQGETFASLYEYYCRKQPQASIGVDEPVALVSFRNIDRPQRVAATRLRLRVMNEVLPDSLKDVDKITPADRASLIQGFWDKLGPSPLGQGKPDLETGFWHPSSQQTEQLPIPTLEFANGKQLSPPINANVDQYKENYRSRLTLLRQKGCWDVPPDVNRLIHFAFPSKAPETLMYRTADDITQQLSGLTGQKLTSSVLGYSSLDQVLSSLNRQSQPGMVVFVFEDEGPTTYFEVAYNLDRWRVKRITCSQLTSHFKELLKSEAKISAAKADGHKADPHLTKGHRLWHSFIEMNALDVAQQLDCVPYTIATPLDYEAQLAIDVGQDKSHFALCLFICRSKSFQPFFRIDTIVERMPYPQRETIPAVILRDKIVEIFCRAARGRHFDPIGTMLTLRDGREYGEEPEGIRAAHDQLLSLGLLDKTAAFHIVDFHKRSLKGIRIWDRTTAGVSNVLEGRLLFLHPKTVVMASTGAATLTQGTAEVSILEAIEDGVDMHPIVSYAFATAQLNWSNPRVAQRLPIALQRTDQELQKRRAQEIRRIG